MRERQDSKVTVNVWYDSLTDGDTSVRVVDSLRVAGVLRSSGLVLDVLCLGFF